jgi:glutathione S-transferase
MQYELFYWPGVQGRGEFVRLALEDAGADYVDMAHAPDGVQTMTAILADKTLSAPPFAPPFLRDGDRIVAQTANILLYLGPKLHLTASDEDDRLFVHQLQLTIADLVVEAHDAHHPIGGGLYYEDQKPEAKRRAKEFREERITKYLGYFERVLSTNQSGPRWLVGRGGTYADFSLFQAIEGLRYAFPKAMAKRERHWPLVVALHGRVAARPGIAAYLKSGRRIPFNESGIFRHYPELDG